MIDTKSCQCHTQSNHSANLALEPTVDALCAATDGLVWARKHNECRPALPSRSAVIEMVEEFRSVLFPGYFGNTELNEESMRYFVGSTLDKAGRTLQEQIRRGLCFACDDNPEQIIHCQERAWEIAQEFVGRLPAIRRMLATDVQAAYVGDPAATAPDETIFCYPGILAITNYRIAHALASLDVPLIPRIITEHAHSITGIDIHPGAEIGESFFIDHGTGVVIGETTIIGDRVRLYQGVTLGAKSFALDGLGNPIKGIPRHPIVEDDVIIYSGATVLGRVVIGKRSIVGGNVWITRDVPPDSRISQAQVRQDFFQFGGGI